MDIFGSGRAREEFFRQNMMGPNAVTVLQEMLEGFPLMHGGRILDLGCGAGLTSAYVAHTYKAQVFAVDLWIPASENYRRFRQMGLEKRIIPIHADATLLPFANDYFDAVVSVDAYQYFGINDTYFDSCLRPLLRDGASVAIMVVGLKEELTAIPEEMQPFWDEPSFRSWRTAGFWEENFKGKLDDLQVRELACFDDAWADWLASDNPHAVHDRAMIKTDGGKYMNMVAVTGRNRR